MKYVVPMSMLLIMSVALLSGCSGEDPAAAGNNKQSGIEATTQSATGKTPEPAESGNWEPESIATPNSSCSGLTNGGTTWKRGCATKRVTPAAMAAANKQPPGCAAGPCRNPSTSRLHD